MNELRDEFDAISLVAMDPNEDKSGINIGSDFLTNIPITAEWALFTDPLPVGEYPTAIASLGLPPLYKPLVLGGHDPQFRLQLFMSFENTVRRERLGKLAVVACRKSRRSTSVTQATTF